MRPSLRKTATTATFSNLPPTQAPEGPYTDSPAWTSWSMLSWTSATPTLTLGMCLVQLCSVYLVFEPLFFVGYSNVCKEPSTYNQLPGITPIAVPADVVPIQTRCTLPLPPQLP